jgi:hypothetical protein
MRDEAAKTRQRLADTGASAKRRLDQREQFRVKNWTNPWWGRQGTLLREVYNGARSAVATYDAFLAIDFRQHSRDEYAVLYTSLISSPGVVSFTTAVRRLNATRQY